MAFKLPSTGGADANVRAALQAMYVAVKDLNVRKAADEAATATLTEQVAMLERQINVDAGHVEIEGGTDVLLLETEHEIVLELGT